MLSFIASSYPLLDAFWTILWIFLFFIWIWLLIVVFSDIFRSRDLGGWGKPSGACSSSSSPGWAC